MTEELSLGQLLEKELSVLVEMNEVCLQKKDVLLNHDLDLLESIVLKEEALTGKLHKIQDICSPRVQLFLKRPNEQNYGGEVNVIKGLIQDVQKKAQELKQNNELNQDMIRDSLNIVTFAVNALSPAEAELVYG